jgi:hypothetical protein
MSRHFHGSFRDPDNHSLHEAKLAAWELAIGEPRSSHRYSSRRMHRGMLPDIIEPEPCNYAREPMLQRLAAALSRWLAWFGSATPNKSGVGAAVAHFGPHQPVAPVETKANDNDRADAA